MLGKSKVKNRRRILLFCKDPKSRNDVVMLLSSHNYLVDIVENYEDLKFRMVNYKPSLLIADVDLLPRDSHEMLELFSKARKKPVFLLINSNENSNRVKSYIDQVDDLLTMPIDADKMYRKVTRAANYNKMQHDIEYHSGIVFILKLLIPILMLLAFMLAK